MTKNDCYQCPHRGEVPGSAHSTCNIFDEKTSAQMTMLAMIGKLPRITDTSTGDDLLKLNPIGVANGWCNYPMDFDPVWVTCNLPIENQ